jgi:hypothetical protein
VGCHRPTCGRTFRLTMAEFDFPYLQEPEFLGQLGRDMDRMVGVLAQKGEDQKQRRKTASDEGL